MPPTSLRKRVLLLAYACSPYRGSEAGVGWNRVIESGKYFDTWVICGKREFEDDIRRSIALADPEHPAIQPARGEIFAERAGKKWKALRHQLPDSLSGDDQQRLPRSAMDLRMGVIVAFDAEGGDIAFQDGALGNAAPRNIDLNNGCGHLRYHRSEGVP